MASKSTSNGRPAVAESDHAEALYLEFLKAFYDDGDLDRARALAPRLERASASPAWSGSIRTEEVRSLIAELGGDFGEAARCREAEIRKILELHVLAANTPHWPAVARQYDHGDVSDRLDLLALLYDRQGQTDRAIAVLHESRDYCRSHHVRFDGADVLRELEGARARPARRRATASRRRS